MPPRMRRVLLAALAVALALPVAAQASGGASIAAAPPLPLGQIEGGGGQEDEFWRLPLYDGDKITFTADLQGPSIGDYEVFAVFAPTITDYSLGNAKPASSSQLWRGC